jgi:hypothetical protein
VLRKSFMELQMQGPEYVFRANYDRLSIRPESLLQEREQTHTLDMEFQLDSPYYLFTGVWSSSTRLFVIYASLADHASLCRNFLEASPNFRLGNSEANSQEQD